MSGETKANISAWNVDTLKEYTDHEHQRNRDLIANNRTVMDERDRLYKERGEAQRTAVDAALTAVKEQTASSFAAAEKAILKAEEAQKEYNARSNEFRGQLDDQAKRLISRTEVEMMTKGNDARIDRAVQGLEDKIGRLDMDMRGLRESRSADQGNRRGNSEVKDESRSNIAMFISVGGFLLMIGLKLMGIG